LIVRTSGDAGALARTLVLDAAVLDPNLRFAAVTLDSLLRMWMLPSRVAAVAATTLAILALGLACIGVYGVLSFIVAQRMREIGIRMALGADARGIIALVLRDGARLLAIGVLTGGACALPAAPLLGRLLFDVSAFDPATMITVPFVLAVSALGACYVPARRASRLQPLTVLRAD
jgi:putative ABC transport system permease protein